LKDIHTYTYIYSATIYHIGLVHHLNQTANRVACLPAHARHTRPIEPARLLALCLPHVSHMRPPGPGLLTSDHLHHSPILRARFMDRFTLSSHTVALPHALLLLRSLPSPATNDLNAALRALAASSNPARSPSSSAASYPCPRLDALKGQGHHPVLRRGSHGPDPRAGPLTQCGCRRPPDDHAARLLCQVRHPMPSVTTLRLCRWCLMKCQS
jgi:hypothetical protein